MMRLKLIVKKKIDPHNRQKLLENENKARQKYESPAVWRCRER
jgi:hypothetical protein